jgi:hypothetical protein
MVLGESNYRRCLFYPRRFWAFHDQEALKNGTFGEAWGFGDCGKKEVREWRTKPESVATTG